MVYKRINTFLKYQIFMKGRSKEDLGCCLVVGGVRAADQCRYQISHSSFKPLFHRFTFARLDWTLGIVTCGGILFAGVGLYLHRKEAREIRLWESVTDPFWDGWEGVKELFRRAQYARKAQFEEEERKKLEMKAKPHKEWVATLTLTEEERRIAESVVVMDMLEKALWNEMCQAYILMLYKKLNETTDTVENMTRIKEEIVGYKRKEYDMQADGLVLDAEGRKVLENLKEPAMERIGKEAVFKENEIASRLGGEARFQRALLEREALLLASIDRKVAPYKEWVDTLGLTTREEETAKTWAVMGKMLDLIVRQGAAVKEINEVYDWEVEIKDGKVIKKHRRREEMYQ
jgi:hypothetical protein